ncbi:MAG: hypothetical protein B7Y45_13585 [Sphingomonas sp. 28-66-16]|nr:MAG: hypothetical protein B7Y45_13585 [Sphingomonas sp. 28-66-16]
MTEPFLGEIQIFGFNYAPYSWAFAAGQLLPIQQNTALFSLLGTIYGGNGTSNYQLPNLSALQASGAGDGPGLAERVLGEQYGEPQVALTVNEMPMHLHSMATYPGGPNLTDVPTSNSRMSGFSPTPNIYATPGTPTVMNPQAIMPAGGSLPHENLQPYLALNYCIALQGTFPSFG